MDVRTRWGSVAAGIVFAFSAIAPSPAQAGTVYFVVAERPGAAVHHDSYVLPLSEPEDIAHARDLVIRGPDAAGSPLVFASVVAGADGINRNVLAEGEPPWNWHVSAFEGFGDFGIELVDGNPTYLESDVQGWIRNTSRGDGDVGHIGFWNYTVVSELAGPVIPLPAGFVTGAVGFLAILIAQARPWAMLRRMPESA